MFEISFCPSCGKEVSQGVSFCPNCGTNLSTPPSPTSQPPQPPQPSPTTYPSQPRGKSPIKWVAVGAALIIILIVIMAALGQGGVNPLAQSHTTNIVNGLVTVNAGYYEYYPINIPSGASSIRIQGSFTASGGSGNDIKVYIMDSTNFVNYQNGHTASTYYNSGQVTTNTFNVTLPSSGTYYLVYDNTFSSFSSKNIQTTVDLIYTS